MSIYNFMNMLWIIFLGVGFWFSYNISPDDNICAMTFIFILISWVVGFCQVIVLGDIKTMWDDDNNGE